MKEGLSVRWQARSRRLAVAVLAACLSANSASAQTPVVVAKAEEKTIEHELRLSGTVTSQKRARLSVSVAGLVAKIHVDKGATVESGSLLLELDRELVDLQLRSEQSRVREAEVALQDARRRLSEVQELAKQRSIAQTTVKDRESEVAAKLAALQTVRASAGYQRALLERHTLRAPFAGAISNRSAEVGEWVVPGVQLYELVATDDLRLDFSAPETYMGKIIAGAPVTFRIAGSAGEARAGVVDTVVPVADQGARTFLVRARPMDATSREGTTGVTSAREQPLLPGMSVQGNILVSTGTTGVVIPRDALLRYPDGRSIVWRVSQGENGATVQEVPVTTGSSFRNWIEVTSGLRGGEVIVIKGNEALRHDQTVQPVQADSGSKTK